MQVGLANTSAGDVDLSDVAVEAVVQAVGQVGIGNRSARGYINDDWTTRVLASSSLAVTALPYTVSGRFPVLRTLKGAIKGQGD